MADERNEAPWDDCKVAFSVNNGDTVWHANDNGRLRLPKGWSLNGTDCSGARCVAIFRVEGIPQSTDGEAVRDLLLKLRC